MMNRTPLTISVFLVLLSVSSCRDSRQHPKTSGNFTAEISGSITGRVSGPGIVSFLPPSDSSFGPRPGYFFIADDTGVRDLGITITIPSNTQPGKYQLVSVGPMNVGKDFEVRVDRSVGNRTESFQTNTTGTITLEQFPEDGSNIAGSPVRGHFEFTAEGKGGQRVTVKGTFDFSGS